MSLRKKTLVIIGTTLVSLIIALYLFSQLIFLNSFNQVEENTVRRNTTRALNALNDEISAIHGTDREWAHWTDSYNFIEDLNDNYREGNTHDGIFYTYSLNVMLYINTKGEIVFGRAFDLAAGQEVPIPNSLMNHLQTDSILLNHSDKEIGELNIDGISGILMLPEGPMIVASTPILTNEKTGPTRGSLVWGRYLNDQEIQELADKTRLSLAVQPIEAAYLSPDFVEAKSNLLTGPAEYIRSQNDELIAGYELLQDIYGNPALILRIELPREIYAQGQASISYFIISLLIAGLIFAGATLILLERIVLSRLEQLNASVGNIGISTDLSKRIEITGTDEISSLATAINIMLEALSQAHHKLEQARDQAIEALQVKAQILANVSHDARTPLSIIMLRSEMLQRGIHGSLTEHQNKQLDTILISARQLLFFINNLLDQSQLDAGKVILEKVPFSISDLLAEVELSMSPLASRKGLQFVAQIDQDLPQTLLGDPNRLNQVVSNLVVNAIKFTDIGSIKVRARLVDKEH
ncbi:MAG: HAMP domain-containing protein, partial [Chitinophagaceae bacterium]|nr:HAMP domain-containing protein [Chitinophagaceae bacterium]